MKSFFEMVDLNLIIIVRDLWFLGGLYVMYLCCFIVDVVLCFIYCNYFGSSCCCCCFYCCFFLNFLFFFECEL